MLAARSSRKELQLKRIRLVKQVFPTFDFLGWYSVGNGTSAADMEIHKQVSAHDPRSLR